MLCLTAGGCSQWDPRPGPIRAMAPRPNPPAARAVASRPAPEKTPDLQQRLRQNRWLARFWSELTPAQRRRVEGRMATEGSADRAEAGERWDVMGLEDRARLVFGDGAAQRSPSPLATDRPGERTAGG